MRSTPEILDALKTALGVSSDYALAKKLGVTRGAVSNWRVGLSTFSDEMALKVASVLNVEAGLIFAICYSERAKTEAEKNAWRGMWEKLGGVAASLAFGIMLSSAYPTESRASTDVSPRADAVQSIHYALLRKST